MGKKDEVTVVQIESEGYNKQTVTVPICAMKGGVDLQKYVDLLVPGPAKMKIIHGEGPINLIGSHCVDYYGFKEDEEEEGDTENEMETEEQQEEKTKKKSGDGKKVSPAKKAESPAGKKDEKKATPEKKEEKKATPTKEESKKRKASSEPKSAEKKSKN